MPDEYPEHDCNETVSDRLDVGDAERINFVEPDDVEFHFSCPECGRKVIEHYSRDFTHVEHRGDKSWFHVGDDFEVEELA